MRVALCLSLAAIALMACAPVPHGEESSPASAPGEGEAVVGWALAIHGGAGVISKDMAEETKEEYKAVLAQALQLGRDHLEGGGSSLDAVEKVVRFLEEDPKFNAGKGAVFTHDGKNELDAAIMDGRNLSCGAVAGVTTVKSPIGLARKVMEETPHILLAGAGAEAFAGEMGVERVDPSYFFTERRWQQLQEILAQEKVGDGGMGTVGAVALDRQGNLAAATSTGGLSNKRFGRVGDVPIIGAGTYADNRTCAVSGTGQGEQFIRHTVARSIAALVEHRGLGLEEAAHQVIDGVLKPGDGGVIAVSRDGSLALVFNSPGMFRAAADSHGRFEVGIWEDLESVQVP